MSRKSPLLFLFILLLILPTTAGRLIIDFAGGVILTLIALPFLIGGGGWIAWKILQSRMTSCSVCGLSTFQQSTQCPACGADMNKNTNPKEEEAIPASARTIDIEAKDSPDN